MKNFKVGDYVRVSIPSTYYHEGLPIVIDGTEVFLVKKTHRRSQKGAKYSTCDLENIKTKEISEWWSGRLTLETWVPFMEDLEKILK